MLFNDFFSRFVREHPSRLNLQQKSRSLHCKDLQAMFLFEVILQQHKFKSTLLRGAKKTTLLMVRSLSSTFTYLFSTGPSSLTETVGEQH